MQNMFLMFCCTTINSSNIMHTRLEQQRSTTCLDQMGVYWSTLVTRTMRQQNTIQAQPENLARLAQGVLGQEKSTFLRGEAISFQVLRTDVVAGHFNKTPSVYRFGTIFASSMQTGAKPCESGYALRQVPRKSEELNAPKISSFTIMRCFTKTQSLFVITRTTQITLVKQCRKLPVKRTSDQRKGTVGYPRTQSSQQTTIKEFSKQAQAHNSEPS